MRVALFTDVYKPIANGVVNHVALLKRHLEALGDEVWLFVPGAQPAALEEPNVESLPGLPLGATGYHVGLQFTRRQRALLRHMDILHVHHPFASGALGIFCARRYHIPLLFTNHTRYDLYAREYAHFVPAGLSEATLRAYFRAFSRVCAAIIAPSASAAQVIQAWGVDSPIAVIPNGVDLERFITPPIAITRDHLGLAPDAVVALFVGRMSGEKNIEPLLHAFAASAPAAPALHLLLVGPGPQLDAYRALAHDLGLDGRATFTGVLPYDQVPGYLHLADFFVSASVTEVHPLTFIEAAAAGLPALGVRSPGVVDVVHDDETGLLVDDPGPAFAAAFLRLAADPALRARLGRHAQRFSSTFSARTTAEHVRQLYASLLPIPSLPISSDQ